jgi:hypothetical protein
MNRARLSLPHEHGGYLTLLGGLAVALVLSPAPLGALAAALPIVAAFFARAPLEKLAFGRVPARWDPAALLLLGALAFDGGLLAVLARGWSALPALLLAPAILAASLLARQRREQRSYAFELAGMAALGASVGPMLLAGGADPRSSAAAAVVLGTHAAVAVPLVRSELRPLEREKRAHADRTALALLLLGALLTLCVGPPLLLLPLVPRALQLALRQWRRPAAPRPMLVGLRESAALAISAGLIAGALAWP